MPKPKKGARLGGSAAHQRLIVANLATQLFEHGKITTTESRARFLRPIAEKLITKAKKAHLGQNPLHQRREVLKTIRDKSIVHELFTEIAPTFAERPGGYTRITKLAPRKGDNAPMAVIEIVTEAYQAKAAAPAKKSATAAAAPVEAEPVEAEAPEVEESGTDETEVAAADVEVTDGSVSGKYDGSHALLEDPSEAPEGFPIKGNENSMKFHTPDGQWFDQTDAEVWFDTEESAGAAGFTKAGE